MFWLGIIFIVASFTKELYGKNVHRPMKCREKIPVCASNGKTYENICDFKLEKYTSKPFITILDYGPCRVPDIGYGRPEFILPPELNKEDGNYNDVPQKGWKQKLIETIKNLMEYLKLREDKKPQPKPDPPTTTRRWLLTPIVSSKKRLYNTF